jgi:hypothetical protein
LGSAFLFVICAILLVNVPSAWAHEHRILTIGNQQVELVVGWVNEPAYVDEVNSVDFWAHYINSTCPQGSVDTVCPVYGLDQSLQVQVMTGGQSQILTFSPNLSNDVPPLFYGEYTASLMPTVPGSISFRLFGNVNGTPVNETFSCGPTTFECVDPATEIQFPQQIPSGHDLQVGLTNVQSQVAQMQNEIQTAYIVAAVGVVVGIIGIAVGALAIARGSKKKRK